MAKLKTKYWIEAGDIKTNLPKQHDTGMFRSLDDIIRDVLKCCGIDCCEGIYPGGGGITNLTYTPSATNGTVVSDTGTDAVIPGVTVTNAGLATPTMFTNSHVPVTTVAGSVTIGLSGTDNQTLKADITGISGATTGQVPSKDALGNITWITPAGGGTITSTDSNTVDFTVTGSDITGSVKLDNANGGLTATTNGLLFNADGVNTYDNTTSGITATTVQDAIDEVAGSFWRLTGNAGTDGGTTNFVGTTDAQDFVLKTNSIEIARFGQQGNAAFGSDLTSVDPSLIAPTANNIGSMAFQSGQATGVFSTAFQLGVASGDLSVAFGGENIASGANSTAFGSGNIASGDISFACGANNTAPSYVETTLGFNATNYTPVSATNIHPSDRLFTIGNGNNNPSARNNALTLWKDGRSMWNGDVAKQNTWIGVNGTNPQNFINITTPTGSLAAISTEHTTSGNYAVLGSNAGSSGLVINDTKQFAFTTTTGTTSTQLGAITTIANYSNTGFLFGGGGVATSTVDVSGTLGLANVRINTENPVLNLNNTVYHFTGGASGTVDMTIMEIDNRTFILTNYSGVSLTLSHSVRTGSATTTTTLPDNTTVIVAYDGVEFFKIT